MPKTAGGTSRSRTRRNSTMTWNGVCPSLVTGSRPGCSSLIFPHHFRRRAVLPVGEVRTGRCRRQVSVGSGTVSPAGFILSRSPSLFSRIRTGTANSRRSTPVPPCDTIGVQENRPAATPAEASQRATRGAIRPRLRCLQSMTIPAAMVPGPRRRTKDVSQGGTSSAIPSRISRTPAATRSPDDAGLAGAVAR